MEVNLYTAIIYGLMRFWSKTTLLITENLFYLALTPLKYQTHIQSQDNKDPYL